MGKHINVHMLVRAYGIDLAFFKQYHLGSKNRKCSIAVVVLLLTYYDFVLLENQQLKPY